MCVPVHMFLFVHIVLYLYGLKHVHHVVLIVVKGVNLILCNLSGVTGGGGGRLPRVTPSTGVTPD